MPAATSFPSVGSSRDAGPIVQMIFALRMDAGAYGHGSAPARLQRSWTCARRNGTPARSGFGSEGRTYSEVEIAFCGLLVFVFVLAVLFVEQRGLPRDGWSLVVRRRQLLAVHLDGERELAAHRCDGGEEVLHRTDERLDLFAGSVRAATRAAQRRVAAEIGDVAGERLLALLALELELHFATSATEESAPR